MSYTALGFDARGADADAWADALLEAGALSVEITDPFAGTVDEQAHFGEPGEDARPWAVSRLTALFAASDDANQVLERAAETLGAEVPHVDAFAIADEDWVRATQSQFGPIEVGDRLAIVPSWCKPSGRPIEIRLDPGLAFGTGSHPTTRLCLEWLLAHVEGGESVLDYGCGSGLLAIAAAKLGAARVVGVDLDPSALKASEDNARANLVAATFVAPDAIGGECYDLVVANILANPLMLLAPALAARVRPGGRIALAGILDAQADAVATAYLPWFTLAPWRQAEGWVLVAGARDATVR